MLHLYAQLTHCSLPTTWRRLARDCCGGTAVRWRQHGRHPAADGRHLGAAEWPVHGAVADRVACREGGRRSIVDLRNVSVLRRLGILRRLPREARKDIGRWLRQKG